MELFENGLFGLRCRVGRARPELVPRISRYAARDALDGIRQVFDRLDRRISFPAEVRFTAADDIPLSTAGGRETASLAVHRGEPRETCFDAVAAGMGALDGRPHWGRLHRQTAETLRPRYPRFDDVLAVRRAVDRAGTFANACTDRVLGPLERHG